MECDLKPLEFDAVRRLLEKLTATPYGRDAAVALEPAPTLELAQRMQAAITAAREALDAGEAPTLASLPDIRAALRQASSPGAALSPTALAHVRDVLRAAEGLCRAVARRPALYPDGEQDLTPPPAVLEALDRTIDGNGQIRRDASEALAELHAEHEKLRAEAERLVTERMQRRDLKDKLSNPDKVVWNQERAVLVIHRDHAERVKGVRRGTAMGGRDVLIEPMEAVQANNRIEKAGGAVSAEQQRVLRQTTAHVTEHINALERLVGALAWIDLALAAGRASAMMNAHAPILVAECRVALDRAYHPQLLFQFAQGEIEQPIPLSVKLDGRQRIVMLSGPNTGGKTVALKTLGLLVTMAHCGLHIPAEGQCLVGRYERVMVDVGDHQSIYHHLSTFAGHVEVLKRILAEADETTLVLLDELGTGTDPDEGAALAMAVLDELAERGVQGIINTHLSPLKDYAASRAEIINASMRFDHDQLRPTYELRLGEPGISLGLTVAEKSGMPPELITRAREHLKGLERR